jgi:putative acetyltransferase
VHCLGVVHAAQAGDAEAVRALFLEYASGLGIDLSFQDFETEIADPLSTYETVLLDEDGCAALRRISADTCELKRLFVRESARGSGLGRRLAEAAIAEARGRGYRRLVLDTLPSMTAARALYASLGFREIAAYRFNPIHGTTYFELTL